MKNTEVRYEVGIDPENDSAKTLVSHERDKMTAFARARRKMMEVEKRTYVYDRMAHRGAPNLFYFYPNGRIAKEVKQLYM